MAKWKELLAQVEESLSNTLSYYGDMVISIGRDYSEEEVLRSVTIISEELRIKHNEYLVPYAERFGRHVIAYRGAGDADKTVWLRELLAIGRIPDLPD